MCYFVDDGSQRAVFTGDTLFLGGCGRFFEGDARQMHEALVSVLGSLPDDTQVFCGHEYTVANYEFGAHAEPDNKHIADSLVRAQETRRQGHPTVPGSIGHEKLTNVFMRVPSGPEGYQAMQELRERKNNYKS